MAGALAATSAVRAVDVKVYPGSACQATFGSQAADFLTDISIINFGAANRSVACPIVRDNHANLTASKASASGFGANGTELSCSLFSFSALGNFLESNTNSTTSTVVTNLPLDINTSTKGGTYSLNCTLPLHAQVFGYRVDEF